IRTSSETFHIVAARTLFVIDSARIGQAHFFFRWTLTQEDCGVTKGHLKFHAAKSNSARIATLNCSHVIAISETPSEIRLAFLVLYPQWDQAWCGRLACMITT